MADCARRSFATTDDRMADYGTDRLSQGKTPSFVILLLTFYIKCAIMEV